MSTTMFGQSINNDRWNFSDYQLATAREIEARPDFEKHVTSDMNSNMEGFLRRRGPWAMLWYDTNGKLNLWRVGVNRILQQV